MLSVFFPIKWKRKKELKKSYKNLTTVNIYSIVIIMKNKGLTVRQKEILNFIVNHIREFHFPPTITEIQRKFYFKSPTAVNDHLNALSKKGFIIRHPGKSRGIAVVNSDNANQEEVKSIQVPIVGQVAAGMPILAEENIEGSLTLDRSLVSQHSKTFALRVKGNSMIDAGIFSGDYVVVNQQPTLNQNEIGVVMLDNEATVKRVLIKENSIKLISENEDMAPIEIKKGEKDVSIIGKVKLVIRKI